MRRNRKLKRALRNVYGSRRAYRSYRRRTNRLHRRFR